MDYFTPPFIINYNLLFGKNHQKVCQENASLPQANPVNWNQVAKGVVHVDPTPWHDLLPGEDPVDLLQHDDAVLSTDEDEN